MYDFSRAIVAQIGHKSLIILYYACVLLSTIEMHILVSSWIRRSICIHYAFVLGWSMHNYKIKDWQMIVLLSHMLLTQMSILENEKRIPSTMFISICVYRKFNTIASFIEYLFVQMIKLTRGYSLSYAKILSQINICAMYLTAKSV